MDLQNETFYGTSLKEDIPKKLKAWYMKQSLIATYNDDTMP